MIYSYPCLHNLNKFIFSLNVLPLETSKCQVRINGHLTEKLVGEIWNSSSDVCMKHTCEIDSKGAAVERTFREYCYHTCSNVCIMYMQ